MRGSRSSRSRRKRSLAAWLSRIGGDAALSSANDQSGASGVAVSCVAAAAAGTVNVRWRSAEQVVWRRAAARGPAQAIAASWKSPRSSSVDARLEALQADSRRQSKLDSNVVDDQAIVLGRDQAGSSSSGMSMASSVARPSTPARSFGQLRCTSVATRSAQSMARRPSSQRALRAARCGARRPVTIGVNSADASRFGGDAGHGRLPLVVRFGARRQHVVVAVQLRGEVARPSAPGPSLRGARRARPRRRSLRSPDRPARCRTARARPRSPAPARPAPPAAAASAERRRFDRAVGSASSTISRAGIAQRRAQAFAAPRPGAPASATRRGSVMAMPSSARCCAEQLEHVAHQFVFLVRLAEVAVDADLERALAMLLAGTRGDHDDRHVAQARVGLHRRSPARSRPCAASRCRAASGPGTRSAMRLERVDAVLRGQRLPSCGVRARGR